MQIVLSDGFKIILDLMIPRSNYLTMPTSFYIEKNNSEFCIEKFLEINKTYDNFFYAISEQNSKKLFTNLEEIENFLKNNYEKTLYKQFIKSIQKFILITFFSSPLVLKELPFILDEKIISTYLYDK